MGLILDPVCREEITTGDGVNIRKDLLVLGISSIFATCYGASLSLTYAVLLCTTYSL